MNTPSYTEKTREALQNAQSLTVQYQNQEMEQEHLFRLRAALRACLSLS